MGRYIRTDRDLEDIQPPKGAHRPRLKVNVTPLLLTPPTVTTTGPEVADLGTATVMLEFDHPAGVAATPLNVTLLVPCDAPKLVPEIVTVVPVRPLCGDSAVIVGTLVETVNAAPLLATPPTVTTTFPVVAPAGTGTTMLVSDQVVGVAFVPLKLIVLVPCGALKPVPVIVTGVPTGPAPGDTLVTTGPRVLPPVTVNATLLLCKPPAVTTTGPVTATAGTGATIVVLDQLVGVAVIALNVTVFAP